MNMSTNRVRRRVVACARCRLRKIMCDAASPSCSKCSQAGVACVAAVSASSNQASAAVPRSIVQFLESELANKEKSSEESKLDDHLEESATNNHILLVDEVMQDCTPLLFLGLTSSSIPLLRCAVAGTRLPSASLPGAAPIGLTEQHQTSLLDSEAGNTRLADIPVSVADFLFENYVKRVVIQNPIFYLPDIIQYFNSVYHSSLEEPGCLSTPYETYVVSLIMAISLTTSARTQQLHANSIAMGLLKTAMQHTQAVYTNDLKGLQAILLLCEYAFLNPSVADVWLLSGFSTQICIDLGLHQETLHDLKTQDPLTIDMRRRVFWCAYEMEIATSAALLRPTCFLAKHINTPFPSEVEDAAISVRSIDASAPATKAFALWIWRYRRIEAEIISVLFHNGEITSLPDTVDLWTCRMEDAIDTWRAEFLRFADLNSRDPTAEEMKLYATIAHAYVIVSLFRPSPRVKEPSSDSLMKAFVACVDVAKGYHAQSNLGFGNSKYVFHPCYHTFSAAIVFLQSLERCKAAICLRYTVDEIDDFISSFSKSFTAIAERWPAASRCLEEFERLMVPVKCKYIDFALHEARAASNGFASAAASLIDHSGGNTAAQPLLYSDELMDFQSLFPHDVFNTQDIGGLPFTIPSDWEFEFDFGIT